MHLNRHPFVHPILSQINNPKIMISSKLSLLFGICLCICSNIFAQTITVGTGSGSVFYDGSGKKTDTIKVKSGTYSGGITFVNVNGTATKPVVIINAGGQVICQNGSDAGIDLSTCRYVHLTGTGSASVKYGFLATGGGTASFDAHYGTSDAEIDHIECAGSSYAGLVFRTYPSTGCQWSVSGGWAIYNMLIHDNYVHDVPGEGMYLGQSHYGNVDANAYSPVSGNPLGGCSSGNESPVIGAKVYNNIVKNVGYDGIQLGGCISGCSVNYNTIVGFATGNQDGQDGGITWNPGSTGSIDHNWIEYTGSGQYSMGIMFQGQGDTYITDNVFKGTNGQVAIAMLRNTVANVKGSTHKNVYIYNNTIGGFKTGYWWYGDNGFGTGTSFVNNLVTSPVSYTIGNGNISTMQKSTNLETTNPLTALFVNLTGGDFHLAALSPAIGKGTVLPAVTTDYSNIQRTAPYDIGAYAYKGTAATVNIATFNSFTATKQADGRYQIFWYTAAEKSTDSFHLQTSTDQVTWHTVMSVKTKAVNGVSSKGISYGAYYYNPLTSASTLVSFSLLLILPLLLIVFTRKNFRRAGAFALVLFAVSCSKNLDTNPLANSMQNNLTTAKTGSRVIYLRAEAHTKTGLTSPSTAVKIQY